MKAECLQFSQGLRDIELALNFFFVPAGILTGIHRQIFSVAEMAAAVALTVFVVIKQFANPMEQEEERERLDEKLRSASELGLGGLYNLVRGQIEMVAFLNLSLLFARRHHYRNEYQPALELPPPQEEPRLATKVFTVLEKGLRLGGFPILGRIVGPARIIMGIAEVAFGAIGALFYCFLSTDPLSSSMMFRYVEYCEHGVFNVVRGNLENILIVNICFLFYDFVAWFRLTYSDERSFGYRAIRLSVVCSE